MAERVDFLAGDNLMSLNLKERKATAREVSKRDKKASKKENISPLKALYPIGSSSLVTINANTI